MSKTPLLSLVIPCYNEAKGLPLLIRRIEELRHESSLQFLLVDNGSKDETPLLFSKITSPLIKTTRIEVNQGYGYGICRGLEQLESPWIGWTHADLQTDPLDALAILKHLKEDSLEDQFLKGTRVGRPLSDRFFTLGMSLFECSLFRTFLKDINAQPTVFSRSFFRCWKDPPKDFSLDLFAFVLAKQKRLRVTRIPVFFGARKFGQSHWNTSLFAKGKFIKRTIRYSFELRKKIYEDHSTSV